MQADSYHKGAVHVSSAGNVIVPVFIGNVFIMHICTVLSIGSSLYNTMKADANKTMMRIMMVVTRMIMMTVVAHSHCPAQFASHFY